MKFVSFGEIMLRLSPPGYGRILQQPLFEACFGGSEANVALSLSQFGEKTAFVTRLPDNDIAAACIRELNSFGVNTDFIKPGSGRMGLYYLEKGASLRAGKVIYDREYSAFSLSVEDDYDWEAIFKDAGWFHFTGITPALSPGLKELTLSAVKAAKSMGLSVSCDLNYRSKLWSKEEAGKVMTGLMPYVDHLIANDGSVLDVFGMKADDEFYKNGNITKEGLTALASELQNRFGFETVSLTARESISASDNNWSAMLLDKSGSHFSIPFSVHIVDRVGAGDAFAAGLIYKLMNGIYGTEAINFAAAAGALKHTVEGDFSRITVDEINSVAGGATSALVQR